MVLPFETPCPQWEIYRCLLVLRQAPAARYVYQQLALRHRITSFLPGPSFALLHEAVSAALEAGRPLSANLVLCRRSAAQDTKAAPFCPQELL